GGAQFWDVGTDENGWTTAEGHLEGGGRSLARLVVDLGKVADPFWCLPGVFWGDHRNDSSAMLYPRFDRDALVPARFRSRHWLISINRLSQPLVAVHSRESWTGLELDPLPTLAGDKGIRFSLGFDWSEERTLLLFRIPEC